MVLNHAYVFRGGSLASRAEDCLSLAHVMANDNELNGACSTAGEGEGDEIEYRWPLDTRLCCSLGLLPFFHAIEAVIGPRNGF